MKLTINGFPKVGNHALLKACELLGQPVDVNHLSYAEGLPEGTTHHIFIKRDPRNTIISAVRFTGQVVSVGSFLTCFRRYKLTGSNMTFAEALGAFEGWLTDANTLVIRYEDLIANDSTMRQIAAYLKIPYLDGAFELLPGLTVTWNEQHSNYLSLWTPQLEEMWMAEGGGDLLKRWGY